MSSRPLVPPLAAVAIGFALVVVPSLVSEWLSPDWAATGDSTRADAGLAVWGILLGLFGLCLLAIGVWVGSSVRSDSGKWTLLQMYGGVVVGTWISVMFLGSDGDPMAAMFLAPFFALIVGVPFWILAGIGLGIGMLMYSPTTSPDNTTMAHEANQKPRP